MRGRISVKSRKMRMQRRPAGSSGRLMQRAPWRRIVQTPCNGRRIRGGRGRGGSDLQHPCNIWGCVHHVKILGEGIYWCDYCFSFFLFICWGYFIYCLYFLCGLLQFCDVDLQRNGVPVRASVQDRFVFFKRTFWATSILFFFLLRI